MSILPPCPAQRAVGVVACLAAPPVAIFECRGPQAGQRHRVADVAQQRVPIQFDAGDVAGGIVVVRQLDARR